jgi:hypothetical protein
MTNVNLIIVEDLEEHQTEKGEKRGEQGKTLRERGVINPTTIRSRPRRPLVTIKVKNC